MTQSKKMWLKIAGAMVLAYLAVIAFASEGTLTDQTTGKPIADAQVIIYWEGNVGIAVESRYKCYQVEATTTDEHGHFRVPAYSGSLDPLIRNRQRNIDFFASGYQETNKSNLDKLAFMMQPRIGTKSEQFKEASNHHLPYGCSSWGDKILLPFLKAMYKDAVELATTPEEKKRASGILFSAEGIEFGDKVAWERLVNRDIQESEAARRNAK